MIALDTSLSHISQTMQLSDQELKHKPVEEKKTLYIVCPARGINKLSLNQNLN